MDLPVSHLPFRSMSNGPTTLDSRQHSFDESSYLNNVDREVFIYSVTGVVEGSLDPWLMDMPGTASPESSRLSMSPSQGIATPPSDGFYSPPYPEQLQLPAYQLLEQPQPPRSSSTSHPSWVNSGENWERNYPESDIWATQPLVAQPWIPSSYDGYTSSNMAINHAHASNGALPPFTYASQSQFPAPEVAQTRPAAGNGGSPSGEEGNEDEDDDDEESDWDEEASNYSQSEVSSSKATSPRVHIDKWIVPVNNIQQSGTRGYFCDIPGCTSTFVRPEHLRRHVRSKHRPERDFNCKIPECGRQFSRGDNLRDHYWTHLHRGGRAGKNRKFHLHELKAILGPKEKKLLKRLRDKLRQYHEKEQLKKEQLKKQRPMYTERSKL